MTVQTRILWLKTASVVVWVFGLTAWLAIFWPPALWFANTFLDVAIWPIFDGSQALIGTETNMLLAIISGFSVSIGIFVWTIASMILPTDQKLARRMIVLAMSAWFIVDSTGSWLGGAGGNVILNVGFGCLFLVPVLWPGLVQSEIFEGCSE